MHIVSDSGELAQLCTTFAEAPYVTVDTEFLRERTYWSQLCLVQLARPGGGDDSGALIDPLAEGIDLAPLFNLMANERVTKVFHAARQDIEIFHHMGGVIPHPLFDTQVAAMVCGYGEQVGYETLARKIAKVTIDKSSRFTDWARRPLSGKQLAYALADVTHLRQIYEALHDRLAKNGRTSWVAEEMATLSDPATYAADPDQAWQRIRARSQSPRFLAVVRSLAKWREINAQDRDVPRSRILKDDALLEVATAQPKTPEELARMRLLQREARRPEVAAEILAAVAQGLACPADRLPKLPVPPRRREGSAAVAELLKVFLKARADEIGVASRLIAATTEIEALAGDEEIDDLAVLKGWRRDVFGADALRLKNGDTGLVARRDGIRLVELREMAE
jgi:ribonuclease D